MHASDNASVEGKPCDRIWQGIGRRAQPDSTQGMDSLKMCDGDFSAIFDYMCPRLTRGIWLSAFIARLGEHGQCQGCIQSKLLPIYDLYESHQQPIRAYLTTDRTQIRCFFHLVLSVFLRSTESLFKLNTFAITHSCIRFSCRGTLHKVCIPSMTWVE
jgi:hypothetical protein